MKLTTFAMSTTLDRTPFELRHERAPWTESRLYRIGRAVAAAGAAPDEEAAHELVWDAIRTVDKHTPVRKALEQAGVDVAMVEAWLRVIETAWRQGLEDREREQWRGA